MTRTNNLIVIFLVVSAFASSAATTPAKLSVVDSLISHAYKSSNIPGIAVGIVADGRTVFQKGYGLRDFKDNQSQVTPNTLFGIGSCSKPFTTYALDRLVTEDGTLAWNDLVLDHIPEFRLKNLLTMDRIQIRDLVTHVSGLPAHEFVAYLPNIPGKKLLDRIAHLESSHDLREKFQYNNLVFSMAGVVLERITGELWQDAIRSRVFEPLNMFLTFPSIEFASAFQKNAIRQTERKDVIQISKPHKVTRNGSVVGVPWTNMRNIAPSGSIVSCVEDMVQWIQEQLSPLRRAKRMHDAQVVIPRGSFVDDLDGGETFAYGMGWMLSRHRGRRLVWCGGPVDSSVTRVVLCPEKDLGIVVLLNLDRPSLGRVIHNLVLRIIDILTADASSAQPSDHLEWVKEQTSVFLGTPASEYAANSSCSHCFQPKKWETGHLAQYEGFFENAAYGTMIVIVDESRLTAGWGEQGFLLKPRRAEDFFSAHSEDGSILACSFARNSSGDVTSFRIKLEPEVSPIRFEKIENTKLSFLRDTFL